jgi:enolase
MVLNFPQLTGKKEGKQVYICNKQILTNGICKVSKIVSVKIQDIGTLYNEINFHGIFPSEVQTCSISYSRVYPIRAIQG